MPGRPDARVVTVSSGAHRAGRMDFDDPMAERRYFRWTQYGQLQAREPAVRARARQAPERRRLDDQVGCRAPRVRHYEPAGAAAPALDRAVMELTNLVAPRARRWALCPAVRRHDARRALRAALHGPDGVGEMRGHPRLVAPSRQALDAADAARLWALSEELTGVSFGLRRRLSIAATRQGPAASRRPAPRGAVRAPVPILRPVAGEFDHLLEGRPVRPRIVRFTERQRREFDPHLELPSRPRLLGPCGGGQFFDALLDRRPQRFAAVSALPLPQYLRLYGSRPFRRADPEVLVDVAVPAAAERRAALVRARCRVPPEIRPLRRAVRRAPASSRFPRSASKTFSMTAAAGCFRVLLADRLAPLVDHAETSSTASSSEFARRRTGFEHLLISGQTNARGSLPSRPCS